MPSVTEPLRLIFHDIDGVLNSWWFMRAIGSLWDSDNQADDLDPDAGARLERIIVETGASVVLSSSCRLDTSLASVEQMLRARGAPSARVIGATPPPWAGSRRGHEIQRWVDENATVGPVVILDDDSDMAHLTPRLVKTSMEHGLLDEHVARAIELLKGP